MGGVFDAAVISYGGVTTVDGVPAVCDELDVLGEDAGEGRREDAVLGLGDIRCVLPPIRSSSAEAGLVRSTDSVLLDASWACLRSFCTTS